MAWSAADDAVANWQVSAEFEEMAEQWARITMRCKTYKAWQPNSRICCRFVDDAGQRADWGCTLWERKP